MGLDGFIDSYPRRYKDANVRAALSHPRFTFHELDLRTADLDPVVDGVEAVVNEAAMPGLPRSWTEFDSYLSNNVQAIERLLEACHRAGVGRFVQASTSSVYGEYAVGDEQLPTRPVSPYGVTKLAAEHLALAHMANQGVPIVIVRYFSVYGPRQRPDMAYHIFCEALLDGRPLTVFGDGYQTRASIYVGDCVEGTIGALRQGTPGEIYNLGGSEPISLLDVIHRLGDVLGVEPVVRHEPARPGDQRDTCADTSKANRDFGYQPTVGPAEGLARQAAWHAELRSG